MLFGRKKKEHKIDPDGRIFDLLMELLEHEFDIEGDIRPDSSFIELEMDELDIMDFIVLVEDELDIRLPTGEYDTIAKMVADIDKIINKG